MSKEQLELLLDAAGRANSALILPHNDPDPDAIASAIALQYLLEQTAGLKSQLAYQGIIGRAENRALVRYLDHPLRHLTAEDLVPKTLLALVDTQPGAGNNPWTPDMRVALVLDHHPWRRASRSSAVGFSDIRPDVGATATILLEYLQVAGLDLPSTLATALFYGIKADTRGLSRNISSADADAYFFLQPRIDVEALAEIERAQVPAAYFKSFATTLETTRVFNGLAISYVGVMQYPDLAAEIADLLLRLEQIDWVVCLGVYQDSLLVAVRTPHQWRDAGALAQAMVKQEGAAGGHTMMAGGQLPLKGRDPDELAAVLSQRAKQFLGLDLGLAGRTLI
ncbi:MAG: DHH family phosphoesterase [Chloroflexota bacterium]